MAINLNGLNIIPQGATLTTGGSAPLGLNNEIRGGVHRVSGTGTDTRTDISGALLQAGMLVYDEATSLHYQYVNVGDAPADPPNPNDPYRDALGNLPNAAENWAVFEPGGEGNSPLEGWTINGTPDQRTPVLHWDPAAGLEEWMPNTLYAVGDRFFTSTRPDFFPDPSTRGNIYQVDAAYFSDDTLDVRNVGNTISLVTETDATALRWAPNGEQRLPTWNAAVTYEIGDVVTYKFGAGSILSTPVMIPPVATTSILRYTGMATGGTGPSEEPLITGNPLITGIQRSSRDWAIETGSIATWNGATSFSFGAYAVYERQLFRALTDVIRPADPTEDYDPPTVGPLWELEADAAILHWRPNTQFYAGNIVFQTGTGGGGIYTVDADIVTGDTFANEGFTPLPLINSEWAGKLFDRFGFYEVGDIVSLPDANGVDQLWVCDTAVSGLQLTDGIRESRRPGGSENLWSLIDIHRGREVVDTWQSDIDYDPGDVVSYFVGQGSIDNNNPGAVDPDLPLHPTVFHFQFRAGITPSGSTTTDRPVTGNQGLGAGLASRQWMVAAGTITPWYGLPQEANRGILQYAAGAYVTYDGHIWRAIQDITKANNNSTVPVPVQGTGLWEQESTAIDSPALRFNQGASPEFSYATGTNRFEVLGEAALGVPLYFDQTSQASGNIEFIDLIPHNTDLHPAWNAFASTSSLAIQVGTYNYPDPNNAANQATVAWPTIGNVGDVQSRIVTEAGLEQQLLLNGLDITPGSVRVGGDIGAFIWRPEVDGIARGNPIGAGTVLGASVSYSGTQLTIPPVGNVEVDTTYVLQITDSDVTGLPPGDYLAQAVFAADAVGNPTGPVQLRDLRLVTGGIARNPIAPLPTGTSTAIALTIHEFTSDVGLLDLLDARNNELVLSVSSANDTVDFTNTPTVQGVPISGTLPFEELIAEHDIEIECDIPTDPANLVADQLYAFRIYVRNFENTSRDLTFTDFRLLAPHVEGRDPQLGPVRAEAAAINNPATITPHSANLFYVSWDQISIDAVQAWAVLDRDDPDFQDLTRPAVNIPGLGTFLANHDVGISGPPVTYSFRSAALGEEPHFFYTPSNSPTEQRIDVGGFGRSAAGQFGNGNVVTWADDGTHLSGDNFTDLLSFHFIMVDSDFPLRASEVVADLSYTFRVYTCLLYTSPSPRDS